MQSLLALAVLASVASFAGCVTFLLVRWLRLTLPDAIPVFACLGIAFWLMVSCFGGPRLLIILLISLISSAICTTLVPKSTHNSRKRNFQFLVLASFCSWWIAAQMPVYSLTLNGSKEIFQMCYWTSSGISPCILAAIVWRRHTSKLRPGVDRHLREGESDSQ